MTEPVWIDRSSKEGSGILLPLILIVSLILLLTAIVSSIYREWVDSYNGNIAEFPKAFIHLLGQCE